MHKFGDCSFCGGEVKNDTVEMDYRYKGQLYIFQDVPAGVCQQCGEKYLIGKVSKEIECIFAELMQGAINNRERNIIYEYWLNLPKPDVENLLIKAGIESGKNKWISKGIGLIDSVIILSARETLSKIWTLDKKLKSFLKKEEIFE